jgi:hypothetical protein
MSVVRDLELLHKDGEGFRGVRPDQTERLKDPRHFVRRRRGCDPRHKQGSNMLCTATETIKLQFRLERRLFVVSREFRRQVLDFRLGHESEGTDLRARDIKEPYVL